MNDVIHAPITKQSTLNLLTPDSRWIFIFLITFNFVKRERERGQHRYVSSTTYGLLCSPLYTRVPNGCTRWYRDRISLIEFINCVMGNSVRADGQNWKKHNSLSFFPLCHAPQELINNFPFQKRKKGKMLKLKNTRKTKNFERKNLIRWELLKIKMADQRWRTIWEKPIS